MVPDGRSFFYEAELHRLRGILLLQAATRESGASDPDSRQQAVADAETHVLRAFEIARRSRRKRWSDGRPGAWRWSGNSADRFRRQMADISGTSGTLVAS